MPKFEPVPWTAERQYVVEPTRYMYVMDWATLPPVAALTGLPLDGLTVREAETAKSPRTTMSTVGQGMEVNQFTILYAWNPKIRSQMQCWILTRRGPWQSLAQEYIDALDVERAWAGRARVTPHSGGTVESRLYINKRWRALDAPMRPREIADLYARGLVPRATWVRLIGDQLEQLDISVEVTALKPLAHGRSQTWVTTRATWLWPLRFDRTLREANSLEQLYWGALGASTWTRVGA